MHPKNLHDAATCSEIIRRVEALTEDARPQWGRMNVAQMLAHCAEVTEVMNGKELTGTPFYFRPLGRLVRRVVLSHKPYSLNSPTHPQYVKDGPEVFTEQKTRLLAVLAAMRAVGPRTVRHPIFGRLSAEDAGWATWKHLDHHLRQFGA